MSEQFDLIIIGAGPGGYTAAVRAAQLGMKVACVEKDKTLGGTCLNIGCIPSKALLESSELYAQAKHGLDVHGVGVENVKLDLKKMMERKQKVVKQLTGGVEYLFKKHKVTWLKGTGRINSPNEVEVDGTKHATKHILIATGSIPSAFAGMQLDGDRVVDSTGALEFTEVPQHLVIIGAGVIGLELGSVWARLGARVTVVEYLPHILPGNDKDVIDTAHKIFVNQGIDFVLGAKVLSVTGKMKAAEIVFEQDGKQQTLQADRCMVSVGRRVFVDGLGLDEVGVELDKKGRVLVNAHYQTNVPGIYAIGDVIPGPMLAHKAEHEAVAAVEHMAGGHPHVNYDAIPGVIYTHPEIAMVGKTEEQLKEAGVAYRAGKFPFSANGRAKALNETQGFVKILADKNTDRILGAHIIGVRAGDMIAELAVAIEFHASAEDVAYSSHAHPTLSEIVKEAALSVDGRPLNI